MFAFLRTYQLDIMLALSSICLIIFFFTFIARTIPVTRKAILLLMEMSAAIWLMADRAAYASRGVIGPKGYWPTRISNFIVFTMVLVVLVCVNKYIQDVFKREGEMKVIPVGLKIADMIGIIAICMVIISQFMGLYYVFDKYNNYHRTKWYFVSYIFPYTIFFIQLFELIRLGKKIKSKIVISLFAFDIVCAVSSLIQYFAYGLSLVDMAAVAMVIDIYVFAYIDMNERIEHANRIEIDHLKREQESMRRLFEQTAKALATAIDAKDKYTQGHSLRVAEYAKEIAHKAGLNEKGCDEVYYAALLHDVGKIGIDDEIIKKDDSLSAEEYEIIKNHSNIGGQILSSIREFPFLSIGAKYHHERYDGSGYPEGLSGEKIPEIARIVAVADTYDAMTSRRSYRAPLPQSTVREEIVKGGGTQFDSRFSDIMVDMIDHDTEYVMKEKEETDVDSVDLNLVTIKEMHFDEYKEKVSDGLQLTRNKLKISFSARADDEENAKYSIPAIILFDSYDGCVHQDERSINIVNYCEYGEIWLDGHVIDNATRNMKTNVTVKNEKGENSGAIRYDIEAVKYRDHVRILIDNDYKQIEVIAALPDAARFVYVAVSGEHCSIKDIEVEESSETIGEDYIPRIADELNYISRIEGDIPNVQIDGNRTQASRAFPVVDGMRICFHTMSLPMANLIWHCPYIVLFSSDDGTMQGDNFKECACIRLDGEDATRDDTAENQLTVKRGDAFDGWNTWKSINKKGYECEVTLTRKRDKVIMTTDNAGISIKNVTAIANGIKDVYVALTGDECALTDIRVLL